MAEGTHGEEVEAFLFHHVRDHLVGRALHEARWSERITVEQATLRDYDFRHPVLDLKGSAGEGALEWYEYPGGFTSPGEGAALASIRAGERRAEARVLGHVALAEGVAVLQLAVVLTKNPDGSRVASFELELRLVRGAAA